MGLNSSPLNVAPLNAIVGDQTSTVATAYRVELRSGFASGNQLVAILDKYTTGTVWEQAVNTADTLKLILPASYAYLFAMKRPCEIHVYRTDGTLSEMFLIDTVSSRLSGGVEIVEVEAKNYLGYLGEYVVLEIDSPATSNGPLKTVQQIVDEILAYTDSRLSASAIDTAIATQTVSISLRSCTCLDAFLKLFEALGSPGYYYVRQYALYWTLGEQSATYYANDNRIVEWSDELDYANCITRLYAYSRSNDVNSRLTLVDAGQAYEYIESVNIGLYGENEAVIEYDVKDSDSLLRAAKQDLSRLESPRRKFSVSISSDSPLALGNTIRVDRNNHAPIIGTVLSARMDLMKPGEVRVSITNKDYTLYQQLADAIANAKRGETAQLFSQDALPDTFSSGAPPPTEIDDPPEGGVWPGESDYAAREDHGPHITQADLDDILIRWEAYSP